MVTNWLYINIVLHIYVCMRWLLFLGFWLVGPLNPRTCTPSTLSSTIYPPHTIWRIVNRSVNTIDPRIAWSLGESLWAMR